MAPRILYLGAVDGWKPKLAGVRRYATRRGWEVFPVSTVGMPYAEIPAVLECMRPDGCIVGCNGGNYFPGKRLFGTVPVVYLDLPARTPGTSSCRIVSCDDNAVVRTAFTELKIWHPESFGVVEAPDNSPWSLFRARAFRSAARSRAPPGARRPPAPWPPSPAPPARGRARGRRIRGGRCPSARRRRPR